MWVTTAQCGRSGAQKVIFTKTSVIPLCQTRPGPPWLCGSTRRKPRAMEICWDVSSLRVAVSHPGQQTPQEKATALIHKPGANHSVAAVHIGALDRERDKQLLKNSSKSSSPSAQAEFAAVGPSSAAVRGCAVASALRSVWVFNTCLGTSST